MSTPCGIEPLTPHIGAILRGVTLCGSPSNQTLATLRRHLARHLVLVIEDQHLAPGQLRDLVANFGPLFHHHADEEVFPASGVPEVLEMRKEADGDRLFGDGGWHDSARKPAAHRLPR